MDLNSLPILLAQVSNTPAADPAGQPVVTPPHWSVQALPLILMVVIIFVMFRSQSKKAKQHAEMLKTIRPGDKIIASAGLVGVVIAVKETTISLRCGDAKLEIQKGAVNDIIERGAETSQS